MSLQLCIKMTDYEDTNYRTDINDLTNTGLRKSQINKNPTEILIFKKGLNT